MQKKLTFEEKIKTMTGKEIVMAMVEGLQDPCVVVDMGTFGETREGICFGCAATNAVCRITGIKPLDLEDTGWEQNAKVFKVQSAQTLKTFEYAIDSLRKGHVTGNDFLIQGYNYYAGQIGMAQLPTPTTTLPRLSTEDYQENLQAYIDYANSLTDDAKAERGV